MGRKSGARPSFFEGVIKPALGSKLVKNRIFYVILLMTTNAAWRLIDPKVEFGAGASGTANDHSTGVQTKGSADQR